MATITVRLLTRRDMPLAAILDIEPATEQEHVALAMLKKHVGNAQSGRTLRVVYPWRKPRAEPEKAEG